MATRQGAAHRAADDVVTNQATRRGRALALAVCLAAMPCPAQGEASFLDPPPRPEELQVPIAIVPAPEVASPAGTPITTGVPFAEGWLAEPSRLRLLTEAGKPVPAQLSVRGTWPRSGGVRWLGVDFALAPGAGRYLLVSDGGAAAPAPEDPVQLREDSDAIVVRTGDLRAEIPRRGGLLGRVWWRGELMLESDETNWFTHLADGRRASDRGDPETRAEVELAGPLHTVVRVDGHYRGAPGDPVPRWTVRLHFHAGRPTIGIGHTFIWVGAAEVLQIRELALGFRLARPATEAAVDRGHRPGDGAVEAPLHDGGQLALVQDRHFAWGAGESRFSLLSGSSERAKRIGGGERAGGWIDASDGRSGVALVLRDLWQQHPKELRAAPDGLTAFLWSGGGESPPLDLRFAALERLFGPRLLATIRTPRDRKQWEAFRDPRRHDPTGMARSHDLLLVFHDGDWRAGGVEPVADAFDRPPLALPDPTWSARTGVLGPVAPRDPSAFPDLEEQVSSVWDAVRSLIEDFGDYGFFGFGSGPHHAYEIVDGRAVGRAWRFTGGIEYGYARAAWLAWLRSGDRSLHELAATHSRYLNDVVLCHEDSRSRRRGDWYWSSGVDLIPWAGAGAGKERSQVPPLGVLNSFGFSIEHALYRWYLTGDARSLEVAGEYAAALKRAIASRPGWAESFVARMNTAQSRHAFQRLEELAVLWEQLGDPWFRSEAERLAGLLVAPDTPAGIHLEPESPGGRALEIPSAISYKAPNLLRYAQAVDGEARNAALAALLRLAEYALHTRDERTHTIGLRMSAAFALSRDPLFLGFGRTSLARGEAELTREPQGTRGYRRQLNGVPSQAYDTIASEVALMAALRGSPTPPSRVPALWKEPGLPAADVVLRKPAGRSLDVQLSAGGAGFEKPDGSPWPESWTRARREYPHRSSPAPFTWRDVRVPADAPGGAYRIRVSREGGAAVLATNAPGVVLAAPGGLQLGGDAEPAWHFAVPRGVTTLGLRASDLRLLELRDARGEPVRVPSGDGPVQVRVSDAAAGVWSVRARRPTAFALEGVAPVFAPAPERLFEAVVRGLPAAAVSATSESEPWPQALAGRGLRLSEGDSLVIPAGAELADGRFQTYDAREGTLEFWLRPDWDAALLDYGSVKGLFALEGDDGSLEAFYRHAATSAGEPISELVVQAQPPGGNPTRFRAAQGPGMRWTPDAWVHVALVWLPGKEGQRWALYVDGRRSASAQGGSGAEWPAFVPRRLERIRLGAVGTGRRAGALDGVVDSIRISSVARYRPDDEQRRARFEPPRALGVDQHTLAFFSLEGDTRGLAAGGSSVEAEIQRAPHPSRRGARPGRG